jgi:hypothetical protein
MAPDGYSCRMFFEANKSHYHSATIWTMSIPVAGSSGGELNNGETGKLGRLIFIFPPELCRTLHMRLCAWPEKAFPYRALMAVVEIFAALQQHDSTVHPIHRHLGRWLTTDCLTEAVDILTELLAIEVPK